MARLIEKLPFLDTVGFRLIAVFCGTLFLLAVLGGVLVYDHLSQTQYNELVRRGEGLARGLAANATPPLLAGDKMQLSVLVETVHQAQDLKFTAIVDHQGRVRMHSDLKRIDEIIDSPPLGDPADADEFRVVWPMVWEGRMVGMVVLGMDAGRLKHDLRALALKLAALVILISVVASWVLVRVVGHILRPISVLTNAAERVSQGDLSAKAIIRQGGAEFQSLARVFNDMTLNLDLASRQIEAGYLQAVQALAAAVEAKDPYTRGHCERVAGFAEVIGRKLGMDDKALSDMVLAGRLHDLGKIGVSEEIIGKPERLNAGEREAMDRHPAIARDILAPAKFLGPVREIIASHHERWDGAGYPRGLKGAEIPLAARVLAIADAFDAMTSDRPYRSSLNREIVRGVIHRESGRQFDPEVVDAFLAVEPILDKESQARSQAETQDAAASRVPLGEQVPLLASRRLRVVPGRDGS